MDSHAYSQKTLERAKKVYTLLAGRVRSGDMEPLTYKQASSPFGFHYHGAMRYVLAKIQDECRANRKATITVLVVDQATRLPNKGCDAYGTKEHVEQYRRSVRDTDWPSTPWWS